VVRIAAPARQRRLLVLSSLSRPASTRLFSSLDTRTMISTSAIIGLLIYLFLFGLLLCRNFISTRLELRNQPLLRVLYESVYDRNNPPFFPALCICILSICTGLMYVAFKRGLIFNIIQQFLIVVWEVILFQRILYILDPFNRVVQQSFLTQGAKVLHAFLFIVCLANIAVYLAGMSVISGDFTVTNLYFMGISLILSVISAVVANFLLKIYFSCSRGLQTSQRGTVDSTRSLTLPSPSLPLPPPPCRRPLLFLCKIPFKNQNGSLQDGCDSIEPTPRSRLHQISYSRVIDH
jgi:hypothetical protein